MNKVENQALELLQISAGRIAVRKAGLYRFPASYRYKAHKHIEYEINYIESGKCVMTFDEAYVPLKAGECIVIPPFHNHGFLVEAKYKCKIRQAEMSIEIPDEMERVFLSSGKAHAYYRLKDCEDIVPLIDQIAHLHRSEKKNEYRDTLLEFAVVQLIVAVGFYTSKTEDATVAIKNEKIVKIMKYIQEHYCESIQIEELAKEQEITSRYVRKYFAEKIGMSCIEYITLMRMNKAKELLWETEKSITAIAMEIGYGTPQYFCRIFKNELGITPSAYRLEWKEKK